VHGADRFNEAVVVTDDVLQRIELLSDLAPLHNTPAVEVIRAGRKAAGSHIPLVAVFDTVFHQTIPEEAALYAIPLEMAKRHGIRRYGFHGTSHRYMMLRYSQIVGRPVEELKLITLHLEGGSSAAAIQHGKSVETSMGFTPLEGLVMGTRCGDIDPAMVTYLMKKERLDVESIDGFLNKDCGLLGVSQISEDTRQLVSRLREKPAELAINIFAHRVRKYIGAYLAVLGGCDAIIFGGGIGENTTLVRGRIARGFGWCGAELDNTRNERTVDCESEITKDGSQVQMWVVPTQEALMIAHDVANCGT
jgi:acetate kinase